MYFWCFVSCLWQSTLCSCVKSNQNEIEAIENIETEFISSFYTLTSDRFKWNILPILGEILTSALDMYCALSLIKHRVFKTGCSAGSHPLLDYLVLTFMLTVVELSKWLLGGGEHIFSGHIICYTWLAFRTWQ